MRIKGSAGKGIFPLPISPPSSFLFYPFYLLYLFLIVTTGKKGFATGRDMQAKKKSRRNARKRSENKEICKRAIPPKKHPTISGGTTKNNKQMSTETELEKIVQFFCCAQIKLKC